MSGPLDLKSIFIPGKVFLLGEYAVLQGARATVWTFPQGSGQFRLTRSVSTDMPFHPESIAGKLCTRHAVDWSTLGGSWSRPFPYGGFGASTAEVIAVASLIWPEILDGQGFYHLWNKYRTIAMEGGTKAVPPSGADLCAQLEAMVHRTRRCVEIQEGKPFGSHSASLLDPSLVIFAAPNRKVETHLHLATLQTSNSLWVENLGPLLEDAAGALRDCNIRAFAEISTRYAMELGRMCLEHPQAAQDRDAFLNLDGVWGAKGSGAMLSDVMLVWVDDKVRVPAVLQLGQQRGLVPVWAAGGSAC